MASTVFVNVFRVDHGDYMYIPIEVQQQYPLKFILQEAEEETPVAVVVEEIPAAVPKKRGKIK